MAAFPSMLEYQEAVQNPRTCFADPELAAGNVVLDPLGLPKPISGGFASVYQVTSGKKHFAVRCFLRTHAEVQDRYARISDFQRQTRPSWMAEFVYLAQGIKVRGQWYPILKMEWIQGQQLNVHIDGLAGNRKGLAALNEKFLALFKTMKKQGVAHGDLQHGNILVAGGALKLIDYDAMYIPGMTGRSHEVGHRNYQHPKRTERDFDANLDHFSAWVIGISLTALAAQPQLWTELAGGDEGLLLRREDLLKPDASKAMTALDRIANAELRRDLAYLRQCLTGDAASVRSPLERPAAPASQPTAAPAPLNPVPASSPAPPAAPTTQSAAAPLPGASGPREQLTASVTPERTILALTLAVCAGVGLAYWQGQLPDLQAGAAAGIALACAGLFILVRFASLPQVRRLRRYVTELDEVKGRIQRSGIKAKVLAEIEASLAVARRLDFDTLLDTVSSPEGQAVLTSLMAFLEEHALTEATATGLALDVSKKLARRGLRDALRLQDIVVSRSMADGEAAESITVVLRNGKGIDDPSLTRAQAEALLAWRGALEKQFVTTASGEERLHFAGLAQRAGELEVAIERHVDVNAWRFVGLVFGIS